MSTQNLYKALKNAYTETNLNKITSHIIEIYRHKNFDTILKLGKQIKDFIDFDISKVNRTFNQMIMLYHPDRFGYYSNIFEKHRTQKDQQKLNQYSHIFIIQEALKKKPVYDNFNYNELYNSQIEYGLDEEDFDAIGNLNATYNDSENDTVDTPDNLNDFLMVIQSKENIDFNIHSLQFYLEQLAGELDISNSDIYDLNGIEHCKNITSLDLSQNQIIDISSIKDLVFLESIYLSNNNISDITVLAGIKNLKYIDLSFNDVIDISSLSALGNLEYLNVIGNEIPSEQLKEFQSYDIVFIY